MTNHRTPTIPEHPAFRRLLAALFERDRARRETDDITGNVNSPDVVYQLRACGWELPCERIQVLDRDHRPVQAGRYSMTAADRQHWIALQAQGRTE